MMWWARGKTQLLLAAQRTSGFWYSPSLALRMCAMLNTVVHVLPLPLPLWGSYQKGSSRSSPPPPHLRWHRGHSCSAQGSRAFPPWRDTENNYREKKLVFCRLWGVVCAPTATPFGGEDTAQEKQLRWNRKEYKEATGKYCGTVVIIHRDDAIVSELSPKMLQKIRMSK